MRPDLERLLTYRILLSRVLFVIRFILMPVICSLHIIIDYMGVFWMEYSMTVVDNICLSLLSLWNYFSFCMWRSTLDICKVKLMHFHISGTHITLYWKFFSLRQQKWRFILHRRTTMVSSSVKWNIQVLWGEVEGNGWCPRRMPLEHIIAHFLWLFFNYKFSHHQNAWVIGNIFTMNYS